MHESNAGSVTGVGLEITYDGAAGSDIVVLTPTADGPADKAGVKAGDVIVSVDGTTTKGLSLYDVSDLLQGDAESQVGKSESREIEIRRLQRVVLDVDNSSSRSLLMPEGHHHSPAARRQAVYVCVCCVVGVQVEVVLHPAGAPSNTRSLTLTRQKVAINPVAYAACSGVPAAELPAGEQCTAPDGRRVVPSTAEGVHCAVLHCTRILPECVSSRACYWA